MTQSVLVATALSACFAACAAMASTGGGPPAGTAPRIAPFAAHFIADWKGINVGTSDIDLKPDTAPGHYLYTWTLTARGIFRLVYSNDVIQKSWITITGAGAGSGSGLVPEVRPERYHAQQGDSSVNIAFDWDALRARGTSEQKPVDLTLVQGTQDILSIQIAVMLDLKNGTLPKSFRILDKDEVKEFLYTLEGPARIHTALGELDTVVVASQRAGNNRILRMWFAPSLGFVPVQAERSRDGKVEFGMRIKTLTR